MHFGGWQLQYDFEDKSKQIRFVKCHGTEGKEINPHANTATAAIKITTHDTFTMCN